MLITVRLDNYITLPYTNIFVLPSVIARASISARLFYNSDNTPMRKTLDEKIFGTGNSLKRKLKIFLGKNNSQAIYLGRIKILTKNRNGKFSD